MAVRAVVDTCNAAEWRKTCNLIHRYTAEGFRVDKAKPNCMLWSRNVLLLSRGRDFNVNGATLPTMQTDSS